MKTLRRWIVDLIPVPLVLAIAVAAGAAMRSVGAIEPSLFTKKASPFRTAYPEPGNPCWPWPPQNCS